MGYRNTHAILSKEGERWLMVIEKTQAGIFPNTIGLYINWMLDKTGVPTEHRQPTREEIIVSVEPEPGAAFIRRIESLDRITKATLRIVRPNPGWKDLETTLGDEADASGAKQADVTMTAKPRSTLAKNAGIVGRIRSLFRNRQLGHAAIIGTKNGQEDSFTTEQLGRKAVRLIELDESGQVNSFDAYSRMEKVLDNDEAR